MLGASALPPPHSGIGAYAVRNARRTAPVAKCRPNCSADRCWYKQTHSSSSNHHSSPFIMHHLSDNTSTDINRDLDVVQAGCVNLCGLLSSNRLCSR